MEQKAGAQIGKQAFIQSLIILFVLKIIVGIFNFVIPAGLYIRIATGMKKPWQTIVGHLQGYCPPMK